MQIQADSDLMQVTQASGYLRMLFGPPKRGQKHRRENGDNGDDDQEFDLNLAFE